MHIGPFRSIDEVGACNRGTSRLVSSYELTHSDTCRHAVPSPDRRRRRKYRFVQVDLPVGEASQYLVEGGTTFETR